MIYIDGQAISNLPKKALGKNVFIEDVSNGDHIQCKKAVMNSNNEVWATSRMPLHKERKYNIYLSDDTLIGTIFPEKKIVGHSKKAYPIPSNESKARSIILEWVNPFDDEYIDFLGVFNFLADITIIFKNKDFIGVLKALFLYIILIPLSFLYSPVRVVVRVVGYVGVIAPYYIIRAIIVIIISLILLPFKLVIYLVTFGYVDFFETRFIKKAWPKRR